MAVPPSRTELVRNIEEAVRSGLDEDEIENQILKPLKLGSEIMASLWLYAWGLRQRADRMKPG